MRRATERNKNENGEGRRTVGVIEDDSTGKGWTKLTKGKIER